MQQFRIQGHLPLFGTIQVGTSKNATLPILAGCILSSAQVTITHVPQFSDIHNMIAILKGLGVKVLFRKGNLYIDPTHHTNTNPDPKYTKQIRSSIFLLGPMLAKWKEVTIAYPGGCKIGARPIDIHLDGLKALGATIIEEDGYIHCDGKNMKAGEVTLRFPSVGATENLMMASVFLEGTTVLHGCAKEPEIVDLAHFMISMGAKIEGAGTDTITITGVKSFKGVKYRPIPDRIITGTYLLACACAGGKVTLTNCVPEHNEILLSKLTESGCQIDIKNDIITIASGKRRHKVPSITTGVYPDFPTDLQSLYLVYASLAKGKCEVKETVFENRFGIVDDLKNMGARITVKGNTAYVKGVRKLHGSMVKATDLRAGAGLVLAGLSAKGETIVQDIYHIDRGYEAIEHIFAGIGADIVRE